MAAGSRKGREILRLVLPSELDSLEQLNEKTEKIAAELGFDDKTVMEIAISVIEAGTNAIMHGNKLNSGKEVVVEYFSTNGGVDIYVKDEGEGFDIDEVLSKDYDPLAPENLTKQSGRGIYIMRSFMDKVEFDIKPSNGTSVKLSKWLPKHEVAN
jgi:serine/threonine-protein kinase RsbW